jgi:hypothetical protein
MIILLPDMSECPNPEAAETVVLEIVNAGAELLAVSHNSKEPLPA